MSRGRRVFRTVLARLRGLGNGIGAMADTWTTTRNFFTKRKADGLSAARMKA